MVDKYRAEVLRCKAFAHKPFSAEQNVSSQWNGFTLAMHWHESLCALTMAQILQPGFSYSHKIDCLSHIVQRNTRIYWLCGVWPREVPVLEFINGHVIKLTLLLSLRLEIVSDNQEGVMVELNICSQLLTWRGRHSLMKSQRFEIKWAFNWIPFALTALLLFYSREVKIRMKCKEEMIFPSFGEEWTGRLLWAWNGTWPVNRPLCICIGVFQSAWSIPI